MKNNMMAALTVAVGLAIGSCLHAEIINPRGRSLMTVDYRNLISRADLRLDSRTAPEAGLPIGNGRAGSVLWMDDSHLWMQVNRTDVFYVNAQSGSADSRDSASACAKVAIDFGGPVFQEWPLPQTLEVYDALATIEGNGVQVRALAWTEADVFAFEVTDNREQPQPLTVKLTMLREPEVTHKSWNATSSFSETPEGMTLTQEFSEPALGGDHKRDHYCATAVTVKTLGRDSQLETMDARTQQLVVPPKRGSFVVLVGSASTLTKGYLSQTTGRAAKAVDDASEVGFDQMLSQNQTWWHDFWRRSFVHLHSDDRRAETVEVMYNWYLYIMACSSRGDYPFQFDGMLFTTKGGHHNWFSYYWNINTKVFYSPLLHAGHHELMKPYFNLYGRNYDDLARVAREVWQAEGIFIPETMAFDGLPDEPEEITSQLSELLLQKKRLSELPELHKYAEKVNGMLSTYNWILDWNEDGFGYTTHVFNPGGKVAYDYWHFYEYNQDESFLREQAYPILKGVAEFFRTHPLFYKETDGKIHTHHTNCHEPYWNIRDSGHVLAAIYATLPLAVRAAEILGVDEPLRRQWNETLEKLTPQPLSTDTDAVLNQRHPEGKAVWAAGRKPVGRVLNNRNEMTYPLRYDTASLEVFEHDKELESIANASYDADYGTRTWLANEPFPILYGPGVDGAKLGRKDHMPQMLMYQAVRSIDRMENRLDPAYGDGQSVERTAPMAYTLQLALLQSFAGKPGGDSVIRVGPAWGAHWNADFGLHASNGFKVTASIRKGVARFVEIESRLGHTCRIRNPWQGQPLDLYRNGKKDGPMKGDLLSFETTKEELITLVPSGTDLNSLRMTVKPERTAGKVVARASSASGAYHPALAVDGNKSIESAWWAEPYPQWLVIDMGKTKEIQCIHVWPYWGGGRYYQYTVEVSKDGAAWREVGDMSRNTIPSTPDGDRFDFEPTEGRYIRLNMLFHNLNKGVHIVEVEWNSCL